MANTANHILTRTGDAAQMPERIEQESYTYQVSKVKFVVTPIYKPSGESVRDILEKLILTEIEIQKPL